jgi:hypothetical protein
MGVKRLIISILLDGFLPLHVFLKAVTEKISSSVSNFPPGKAICQNEPFIGIPVQLKPNVSSILWIKKHHNSSQSWVSLLLPFKLSMLSNGTIFYMRRHCWKLCFNKSRTYSKKLKIHNQSLFCIQNNKYSLENAIAQIF